MDYVDKAEKAIRNLKEYDKGKIKLTVSQIRKFLTAVNLLRNKVDSYKFSVLKEEHKNPTELSEELAMEIKFLRVNILYQVGREGKNRDGSPKAISSFVEKAELAKYISDIGKDINKFYQFCKYMEALVAFHKFYGGKD